MNRASIDTINYLVEQGYIITVKSGPHHDGPTGSNDIGTYEFSITGKRSGQYAPTLVELLDAYEKLLNHAKELEDKIDKIETRISNG